MRLHSLVPFVPLLAALPAQTTAATAATDPPAIRIETVGPDGWRLRLGPTNLGSLLESEAGQKLWQPRLAPLLDGWRQLAGGDDAFAVARPRVLGYGGLVRVGLWFGDSSAGDDIVQAAFVFDGDGRTDLVAMAKDLRDLQYQSLSGAWETRKVGAVDVEVRTDGSDVATAPLREGDHLLVAMCADGDLDGALRRARDLASTATGKAPAPSTPALRLEYDLRRLPALQRAAAGEDRDRWLRSLGALSLGVGAVTIGAAGPHVQVEVTQDFVSDERGLFAALWPAATTLPRLVAAAPPSPNAVWRAGRFDVMALWRTIEGVVVAEERQTKDELRAEVRKELGVDLEQDLLAHMTDEMLVQGEVLRDEPEQSTWSLAWRLTDAAAFGKHLATMLRTIRPLLSKEATTSHDGVELHRYGNMLGYDLWLAVGNGVFVCAGGRDAEEHVGAVLDQCKRLAAAEPAAAPPAPPALFAELQRFLPAGLHGVGSADVGMATSLPGTLWLGLLDEVLPGAAFRTADEPDSDAAAELHELLRQHRLDRLRSASGNVERRFAWRLWW
jgi:hypothetical protein